MKSGGFFGIKYLFIGLLLALIAVVGIERIYSDGTPAGKEEAPGAEYAGKEEAYAVEKAPAGPVEEPIVEKYAPPAEGDDFTQNHLAKMLARVLAIEDRLPAAASADDYFNLLTVIGVAPMDGWEIDAPVSRDDLAVVMVQALGLQGEVEDTMDPQCYIDVLKSEGVDLEKGMFNVEHGLSFPTVVNSFNALKFGDTVADNYNTSLSAIGTTIGY